MGFGKSLKKFVKKAAPIIGAVAPFFLPPGMGAAVGAIAGGMGGGGVKGALMGGLGGYAAGGFGQGVRSAGGLGSLFNPAAGPHTPGFFGRLGNLARAGMRGIQQTPLAQGIGRFFSGAGQPTMGAQGGVKPYRTNIGVDRMGGGMPSTPVSGAWGPQTQFQPQGGFLPSGAAGSASLRGITERGFIGPGFAETSMQHPAIQAGMDPALRGPGANTMVPGFAETSMQHPAIQAGMDPALRGQDPVLSGVPIDEKTGAIKDADEVLDTVRHSGRGDTPAGVTSKESRHNILQAEHIAEQANIEMQASGEPTTWESLVDFARKAFNEQNRPLTTGILAALAQWWENKQNPEFQVAMGEGLDYDVGRGTAVKAPVLTSNYAKGGYVTPPGIEMDLRQGGFVPIGSQQKADDVAARVSKDEFVMTADAVKAAGGGSIARGSQKMYDLMNRLEGAA